MNYSIPLETPASALRTGRSGFSREADYIEKEKRTLTGRLLDTVLFGDRERTILSLFTKSLSPCLNSNWDGYNALPVSLKTYTMALEFLISMPASVKLPDITADPDGSVSMEWYRSPEWIFSISIDAYGKLDYAALFGDRKYHGSMYYAGEVDKEIINLIGRV